MELRNLITFIHVAELGSFTKAAEQLGYSQSTVSFQIKQLEDELACLLFERINHTITLTERGHELVSDDMINRTYIDFHNKYPSISVKFTTADTSVMFDMLDHNEADVIITLDTHSYQKDYIIAKEEPLSAHFIANSKSKFAGIKGLTIKDIINEPFILTEYGQGYRRVLDKELAKNSMEITPVLEIGRTDIITSLIAQSDMISFLPDFVTNDMVKTGTLSYLDVCDINVDIWKQLIYHKNKWMSKALKTFIEYIKNTEFTNSLPLIL